MSSGSAFSRTLAEAFLSGRWSLDELETRGKLVLQLRRNPQWFLRLVRCVFIAFDVHPPKAQLVAWIDAYSAERGISRYLEKLPTPSLLYLPRQAMLPVTGLPTDFELPPLVTLGDLADWLGLTVGELHWFADRMTSDNSPLKEPLRHYRYRCLRKRSGKLRLLEIPKSRLKRIQQEILHGILDEIPPHPAAHAYRAGRSVVTYVAPHAGRSVILHIDLQNFFPSLQASRVQALFRTVGYPERVARALTSLCTHRVRKSVFETADGATLDDQTRRLYECRHLPQGAPTSPALANLCAYRLDVRLTALATRFGANYTRYADDLLFSGGPVLRRGMLRFRILVLAIAIDEGFSIRANKTRIRLQSQSQRVAGIVLNDHPNPPRQEFDRLKAVLFNCVRHGPLSQNRDQRANFAEHLLGRIAYLTMINADRGQKLRTLFDRISWP